MKCRGRQWRINQNKELKVKKGLHSKILAWVQWAENKVVFDYLQIHLTVNNLPFVQPKFFLHVFKKYLIGIKWVLIFSAPFQKISVSREFWLFRFLWYCIFILLFQYQRYSLLIHLFLVSEIQLLIQKLSVSDTKDTMYHWYCPTLSIHNLYLQH